MRFHKTLIAAASGAILGALGLVNAMPAQTMHDDTDYKVGDIIYWPPGRSFVIMYARNGGRFGMQKMGHVDSGVEIFKSTGNTSVSFELFADGGE